MKKIVLSISAVCAAFTMNAQNLFSDDFEQLLTNGGVSDWSVFNNDTDTFGFGFLNVATASGNAAHVAPMGVAAYSESWYDDGASGVVLTPDNFFISPEIDLSAAAGTITLTWDVASIEGAASTFFPENYSMYVVSDLTTLATATPVFTETLAAGGVVYSRMADISAMAGGSAFVVVRHHNCTDENFILFDNFSVDQVLGINEGVIKTSVYPNPANDVLNIVANEEIVSVSIVSLDGKVAATSTTSTVQVAGLTSGMYIYEVTTASGKVSRDTFMKK